MFKKQTMNAKEKKHTFSRSLGHCEVDFIHCDFGGHKDVMEIFIDKRKTLWFFICIYFFQNQLY